MITNIDVEKSYVLLLHQERWLKNDLYYEKIGNKLKFDINELYIAQNKILRLKLLPLVT